METTNGSNNATGVPNSNIAEPNQVEETPAKTIQQMQLHVAKKKTEPKSAVWQFFERQKDEHGIVVKGKCL